ncbi:MAG: hypothetical protein ACXIUM_12175 [Wenzhouxiangella sp.]
MRAITLLLTMLLALGAAADDDVRWRSVPYADMHEAFMRGYIEGEYIRSKPAFQVRGSNFSLRDLRVEIDAQDGTIVVNVQDDGLTDFPLEATLAAENPEVRTNAPRGGLGAAMRYSAEAPPQQEFRYGLLLAMIEEYRSAVRSLGLMARLSLPRPNGLLIEFHNAEAYAIVDIDGGIRLAADENQLVFIGTSRAWREQDPMIRLSERPQSITLALDD